MSDLYTRPDEARRRLAESTDTGNFFQDTFTDAVSDGISLGADGKVKREGLAWWMQGFTPGARSIAEQKKGIQDSEIIDRAVQNSGLTDAQLREAAGGGKLTSGNVRGTIAEGQRTRAEKPTPLQTEQIESGRRAEGRQITAMEETTNARKDTNALLIAQMASDNKNRLADRAEAREARADDRMMQLEMYERADRKAEKNRRRESIQALVAGLSSLGAAFAV